MIDEQKAQLEAAQQASEQELAQGETSAVLNDPKVITAYLGE